MANSQSVYILGGAQTDFARNWTKEGKHFVRRDARGRERRAGAGANRTARNPDRARRQFCRGALRQAGPSRRFLSRGRSAFSGLPTSRHEAACASGSIAILAASAEIEAGRYDLAAVVGVEQMKTVDSATGGDFLGTAAWYEREGKGVEFPFPKLFGRLGDEYDKRYGLKDEYLAHISAINYSNAKRNPLAQTRSWYMSESDPQQAKKFNSRSAAASKCAIARR